MSRGGGGKGGGGRILMWLVLAAVAYYAYTNGLFGSLDLGSLGLDGLLDKVTGAFS